MKTGTVILGLVFALMSVNTAFARGSHGHHKGHGHNKGHHYNSGRHYGHNKHHHNTHYEAPYYDRVHHDTYREVHHYDKRHQGDQAAYLIGGLVVGGIIGAALSYSNQNATNNSNYRQPAYANPYR